MELELNDPIDNDSGQSLERGLDRGMSRTGLYGCCVENRPWASCRASHNCMVGSHEDHRNHFRHGGLYWSSDGMTVTL